MSRLIPGTGGTIPRPLVVEDYRIMDGFLMEPQYYTLWPWSSVLLNGDPTLVRAPIREQVVVWEPHIPGAPTMKKFSGYTRDRNGTIVGGCTVYLVHASDGVREASVTSNNSTNVGYFEIYGQTTDNYIIEAFLPGSPDVAGVTDNNLTGT